jgi:putative zinc finger/helix-turn-helix YgiT family protein
MGTTKERGSERCPVCGHALTARIITDRFDYDSDNGLVQVEAKGVPVKECTSCGEVYLGPEAGRIRHNAVCRALGLLCPDEIKAVREGLSKSQEEFAELTGIGVATISRWERGRLLQSRAHDRYLRLIAKDHKNVGFLASFPSFPAAESSRT